MYVCMCVYVFRYTHVYKHTQAHICAYQQYALLHVYNLALKRYIVCSVNICVHMHPCTSNFDSSGYGCVLCVYTHIHPRAESFELPKLRSSAVLESQKFPTPASGVISAPY